MAAQLPSSRETGHPAGTQRGPRRGRVGSMWWHRAVPPPGPVQVRREAAHRTQQPGEAPEGCTCSPRSAAAHRPRTPPQGGGGCVSHELSAWAPRPALGRAGSSEECAPGGRAAEEGCLASGKGWKEGGGSKCQGRDGPQAPRPGTDCLEDARGAGWDQPYLSCGLRPSQC